MLTKARLKIDRSAVVRIENQQRCVFDYELAAISEVLKISKERLIMLAVELAKHAKVKVLNANCRPSAGRPTTRRSQPKLRA